MDNKTNRGKLVRKYIGEEIEKFKFEYKGYQNDSWKYERKFKGVIQTISIYPYRFDQRMITFELYTDVKNSAYASEMGTCGDGSFFGKSVGKIFGWRMVSFCIKGS